MCSPVASPDLTQTAAPGSPRRARLRRGPWPCPRRGGRSLKALRTGAVRPGSVLTPAAAQAARAPTRLRARRATWPRWRGRPRCSGSSRSHRWLSPTHASRRRPRCNSASHVTRWRATRAKTAHGRAKLARHRAQAERQRLPRVARALAARRRSAACSASYCGEALRVARCESGLQHERPERPVPRPLPDGDRASDACSATATAALEQATAAHRYFVELGPRLEPVVLQAL